ncbi:unannotated protein [freshwater metagenome]|uniref:Unannotated protein n=1 Tax=freshwater metagenome TaxID=449393 RepID=A0A6J7I777_9ZZZZ
MNLGTGRNRRKKPETFSAVVHGTSVAGNLHRKGRQLRHEAQCQETVGHGTTEWAFLQRTLDIDVDPLTIASELREVIDHLLRHLDRFAPLAELFAGKRINRIDVVEPDLGHGPPSRSRARRGLPTCGWR